MVSRIDGPSAESCLAMINNTLEAEKSGLKGKIYVDTRGIKSNERDALTTWDKGMKDLGWFLRDNTEQKVNIDIFPNLIEEAKDTAIYAGWYQLRKFEGDFTFVTFYASYLQKCYLSLKTDFDMNLFVYDLN